MCFSIKLHQLQNFSYNTTLGSIRNSVLWLLAYAKLIILNYLTLFKKNVYPFKFTESSLVPLFCFPIFLLAFSYIVLTFTSSSAVFLMILIFAFRIFFAKFCF